MKISEIKIRDNRRKADEAKVYFLSESIQEIGLQNPITVRPDGYLIGGLHRLEAYRLLGYEEIPVTVVDLDDLRTELAELDENLIRNEGTALDRAEWMARRKVIYLELYPETKQGVAGGKASGESRRTNDNMSFVQDEKESANSFTKDAAARTGVSAKTVEREVKIGEALSEEVKHKIRGTWLEDAKTALLEISRLNSQEQLLCVEWLLDKKDKKVSDWSRAYKEQIKQEEKANRFEEALSYANEEGYDALSWLSLNSDVVDLDRLKSTEAYVYAQYLEEAWKPPLYNVWTYGSNTNTTLHFGNTEQRIVDNLLYLYTEPFDIVVDPFAGGGSTIDICQYRLRRYWVSDRLPVRDDIRTHEISDGILPLGDEWKNVSLLYLDPPYWKQAQGEYSDDPEDLANMELDKFYDRLTRFIWDCADKMPKGSHIALIIQPTQWRAADRHYPSDHVVDLIEYVTYDALRYKNRIICPYSTEQYNAQQVNWAKENKEVLTLNRELIIWTVQ